MMSKALLLRPSLVSKPLMSFGQIQLKMGFVAVLLMTDNAHLWLAALQRTGLLLLSASLSVCLPACLYVRLTFL